MDSENKQAETLRLLIEHELALQGLYLIYSEQLYGYREFWGQLAEEEAKHAEVIRQFEKEVEAGNVCFNAERFQTAAIERSLRYIFELSEQADKGEINLNRSLSEAFYIEDAMIEHKFFEVFDGDSQELKQALWILEEDTKAHREHLKEALEANQ
jgi:hypothetical protein